MCMGTPSVARSLEPESLIEFNGKRVVRSNGDKYLVDFFRVIDPTLFFEYYQGILNRGFPDAASTVNRNEVGSSGKQDLHLCSLIKDLAFLEYQELGGAKKKFIGERFGEYNAVAINSLILPQLLP